MFTDKVEKVADLSKMPEEFQDLLRRVLTIQADAEIGGPHLYVQEWLLHAPTPYDMWRLTRIAAEEMDHYRAFARLLRDMEVDVTYLAYIPKSQRMIEVFRGDMPTWSDVAAFSFFIDRVGLYMLEEFNDSSYVPLNNILPRIITEEQGHIQFGELKLNEMVKTEEGREEAQRVIDKWYPRALDMFGRKDSPRSIQYMEWGLKRRPNEEARQGYIKETAPFIKKLGLQVPPENQDRHFK